jgi:uncharacterized membrane protein
MIIRGGDSMNEPAHERSMESRLARIERRLERIEALFELRELPGPVDGGNRVERDHPREEAQHPVPPDGAPQAPGLFAVDNNAATAPVESPPVAPPPLPPAAPVPVAVPVIPLYAAPAPSAPPAQTELEQTIGLKWAGWVGAVVVVIGAGLGIKYAYDQGWFEILPPAGRLALMSLGAFALIGAGEFVYRRIHRFAAACLFGAGVATLFLVSYAGHGYYRLYERETAFVLMAVTTVVGAAVAMRGNMASIAVLAQVGGNLAPFVLGGDTNRLAPFLTYLLTLQVVALFLAWWGRDGKWGTLRGMSLATTSLWMLTLLAERNPAHATGTLLSFSLLYAALFQAELLLSAIRPSQLVAETPPPEAHTAQSLSDDLQRAVTVPVVTSLLVTALLTCAVLATLHGFSEAARGAWVLGLGAVCGVVGFLLKRHRGRPAVYALSFGFRIQAAGLLVLAVPVALSGVWVMFGWAILSLAFATLGNLLRLRISRWAGVMVWRLALLYLGWWTVAPIAGSVGVSQIPATGAHAVWLHLFGVDLRAYTVLAWFLAAVGHTVAWLIHQEGLSPAADPSSRRFQRLAWITNGLAGFAWITASIAGLPPAGATLAIVVYAWLLLAVDLLNPRLGLVYQAAVVVVLATVKWVAVDTLADRLSPDWSPLARRPVFNAVMGVGVLLSLTMGALYWLRRDVLWNALTSRRGSATTGNRVSSPAEPILALAAVLTALFTVGLTFEIDRIVEATVPGVTVWPLSQVKQMASTILWTIAVCGYLALSRRLEPDEGLRPKWIQAAERVALILAAKFLLVDTLFFRLANGAPLATPLVNFQMLTALVVVGGMVLVAFLMTRGPGDDDGVAARRRVLAVAGFLAVLVVLWGGTLEIDRAFERLMAFGSTAFTDPRLAKQVAFSIFWSLFAVGCVVAGFRFRTAGLRYFGLGLFAVTLTKVFLVDMGQVQRGYRVLSFLGLGLLLLGTSVLYGKLTPLLIKEREPTGS